MLHLSSLDSLPEALIYTPNASNTGPAHRPQARPRPPSSLFVVIYVPPSPQSGVKRTNSRPLLANSLNGGRGVFMLCLGTRAQSMKRSSGGPEPRWRSRDVLALLDRLAEELRSLDGPVHDQGPWRSSMSGLWPDPSAPFSPSSAFTSSSYLNTLLPQKLQLDLGISRDLASLHEVLPPFYARPLGASSVLCTTENRKIET